MSNKIKNKKSSWFYRPLFLAIFVALFFSLSMTWVELDPVIDHQRNVEILRSGQAQIQEYETDEEKLSENAIHYEKRVRHTDGIVFGSSLLVVIIVGGVMANIRKL